MELPPELAAMLTGESRTIYENLPPRRKRLAMQMMLAAWHMTGGIDQAQVDAFLADVEKHLASVIVNNITSSVS